MPPKDILKFFDADIGAAGELQSQATLHRRTNKGKAAALPPGFGPIALPRDVVRTLSSVDYVGRYSLAMWFGDARFVEALDEAWRARAGGEAHDVLDAVVVQPGGVVVAQSTVAFWRRVSGLDAARGAKRRRGGGRGGGRGEHGRDAARASMLDALAAVVGRPVPRPQHAKLLNWRTSQVESPARPDPPVVTASGGALVFTGDWCVESSFEGCHRAARAAADAVASHLGLDSSA